MRPEMEKVLAEIEKVIAGKRDVIMKILTALLADGHVLLDDVPGVGKTTLAVAISRAVDLHYKRVQFTPDVLPSDLVGFSMYDKQSGGFSYHPGALNDANLLLGDEINRAGSKTQSALLEAMEERQVTVDGTTYPLRGCCGNPVFALCSNRPLPGAAVPGLSRLRRADGNAEKPPGRQPHGSGAARDDQG